MRTKLIRENLSRQTRAMLLLKKLLEEEFSRLLDRNAKGVSHIEMSIQELMRQLAAERMSLRRVVQSIDAESQRVHEVYGHMGDEVRASVEKLLSRLDKVEQECAVQAAKNQELSLALYEQSKALLGYLHNLVKPKKSNGYGANGRMAVTQGEASLVSGRL